VFAIAPGAVIGESIQLHDQGMRRPERVDFVRCLVALEHDVEPGFRQSRCAGELVVAILELAPSWPRLPRRYHAPQGGGASAPARAQENVLDCDEVEHLEPLGPIDRA
jgi:hypothetical protein